MSKYSYDKELQQSHSSKLIQSSKWDKGSPHGQQFFSKPMVLLLTQAKLSRTLHTQPETVLRWDGKRQI